MGPFRCPQAIVNCAAYTHVDAAEFRQPILCEAVNYQGVKNLIDAAHQVGKVPFIQISTDYVFDGLERYYNENSHVNPLNVYGRSKAYAEKYVLEHNRPLAAHYVLRTSGLFSLSHKNFVTNIIAQAEAGKEIQVVNDQRTRFTYAPHLADAIVYFLETLPRPGIYHIANKNSASWYDFACGILAQLNIPTVCCACQSKTVGGARGRHILFFRLNATLRCGGLQK